MFKQMVKFGLKWFSMSAFSMFIGFSPADGIWFPSS